MAIVRAYLYALWADVVARVSGIASVVFTFASVYSDAFNGIPGAIHARKFWRIAAAICFIYANFRLWADEHRNLVSQLPNFKITLEHVDWEYQPDINETAIIIAVSIVNVGAPSFAQHWKASIIVGGIRETLKATQINKGWILPDPAKKYPIVILPQDQISFKTAQGRIETGDARMGRSFHTTPGNRELLMNSLNWTIELACDDYKGTTFTGILHPHPGAVLERKAFPGEQPLTPELWSFIRGGNDETRIPRRPESGG